MDGKLPCIGLIVCLLSVFGTTAATLAEKRVALVIGNAAYQNTPALANPVNDAEDVAAAMSGVGFTVVLERNLDRRGLEAAIARFSRLAQDADAAMFYYAGHGIQHQGFNYIVPVDARLDDEFNVRFELTRLDEVLLGLEQSRGVKILVLDACRNSPLLDRLNRRATTRDLWVTRGLAKIEPTRGMVIAYSTQTNQVAVDGEGRNSPFATALLRHLNQPGLEVGTLFRRVASEVNRATEGRQLPELSLSLLGEFYFAAREPGLPVKTNGQEQVAAAKLAGERTGQVKPAPDVPGSATIAMLPAPDAAASAPRPLAGGALVEAIKRELRRVGCYSGPIDGMSRSAEAETALKKFARLASLPAAEARFSVEVLDTLRGKSGRVCPLECAVGEVARGDACVAKTCRAGEQLSKDGRCVSAPSAKSRPRPARAGKGRRCFVYGGTSFCE